MPSIIHQLTNWLDGVVGTTAIPIVTSSGSIPVSMFIIQADIGNAAGSYIAVRDNLATTARGLQLAPGKGLIFEATQEQIENATVGILQCENNRPRVCLDLTDYFIIGSAAGLVWHCAYWNYDTR